MYLQTTSQNNNPDRPNLCDDWGDIHTAPSCLGDNEDSIDDSINDGNDAASDIDVPVIYEEEGNVLLEDVNEQDPGDIVNNYDYEIIWSVHRGLLWFFFIPRTDICKNHEGGISRVKWIIFIKIYSIRVITKLPNSEQSYKGKVKTHNYINRQNQSTTGKLWKP